MKKLLLPFLLLALFSVVACDEEENIVVNDTISNFIAKKYEGAAILYAEREYDGTIEVNILHDGLRKDVYFNKNEKWLRTSWDVYPSELPDAVHKAIQTEYPDYEIDDVDYVEREAGNCYRIELDKGIIEKTVNVSPEGKFVD